MVEARSDVVGSLLRPPRLLAARQRFNDGGLSTTQFKAVEDDAVEEALRLQEAAGVAVVTDGEMRRVSFQSQVPAAAVIGKLRRRRSLCAEEFAYARGRTHRVLKVTLPSPSLFANFWDPERAPPEYGC